MPNVIVLLIFIGWFATERKVRVMCKSQDGPSPESLPASPSSPTTFTHMAASDNGKSDEPISTDRGKQLTAEVTAFIPEGFTPEIQPARSATFTYPLTDFLLGVFGVTLCLIVLTVIAATASHRRARRGRLNQRKSATQNSRLQASLCHSSESLELQTDAAEPNSSTHVFLSLPHNHGRALPHLAMATSTNPHSHHPHLLQPTSLPPGFPPPLYRPSAPQVSASLIAFMNHMSRIQKVLSSTDELELAPEPREWGHVMDDMIRAQNSLLGRGREDDCRWSESCSSDDTEDRPDECGEDIDTVP